MLQHTFFFILAFFAEGHFGLTEQGAGVQQGEDKRTLERIWCSAVSSLECLRAHLHRC